MTINEITSAIRNRVADGLSGNISNQAYSLDQLNDEVDLQRADFTHKYSGTNKLNTKYLLQTIDSICLECRDLSKDCVLKSGDQVPSIKIPQLLSTFDDSAIEFIGLVNKQEAFKVYYSTDEIRNHQYRRHTKHKPFVWVDNTLDDESMITLYFFNMGNDNPLQYVSIRAMFERPTWVSKIDPVFDEKEYPAPAHMQNSIIDALTEKYVRYFRQLNIPTQPNTQTDNIT